MSNPFSALAAAAGAAAPIGNSTYTTGRTLYIDGDGLAYYCAGKDDDSVDTARGNIISFIEYSKRRSGAEFTKLLVTASGSSKGDRFAVARVKPYQGQRANSRRPKNWAFLRELLAQPTLAGATVEVTADLEADDLFGKYAYADPANTVIQTQDKDMRMLPGWHMAWSEAVMHYVEPGTFCKQVGDKVYGSKWFWLQMLHGDTADNVPGLPKYTNATGVSKPVGPVTAAQLLSSSYSSIECYAAVRNAYLTLYGQRFAVEMLEQGILLWMRGSANWDDVLAGPLSPLVRETEYEQAYAEIETRVTNARTINASSAAKDNPDSGDAGAAQHCPSWPLCPV